MVTAAGYVVGCDCYGYSTVEPRAIDPLPIVSESVPIEEAKIGDQRSSSK